MYFSTSVEENYCSSDSRELHKIMTKWHGWLIEQSLDNQEIFNMVPTLFMKSEEEDWKERVVEISDSILEKIIQFLKEHLKEKWYAHLVKDNEIKVVFKDKVFSAKIENSFKEIEGYGVDHGVPKEQMQVQGLFDLARKSGF